MDLHALAIFTASVSAMFAKRIPPSHAVDIFTFAAKSFTLKIIKPGAYIGTDAVSVTISNFQF